MANDNPAPIHEEIVQARLDLAGAQRKQSAEKNKSKVEQIEKDLEKTLAEIAARRRREII